MKKEKEGDQGRGPFPSDKGGRTSSVLDSDGGKKTKEKGREHRRKKVFLRTGIETNLSGKETASLSNGGTKDADGEEIFVELKKGDTATTSTNLKGDVKKEPSPQNQKVYSRGGGTLIAIITGEKSYNHREERGALIRLEM